MSTRHFDSQEQDERYREATRRLAERASAIAFRTSSRLLLVQAEHDLEWRSLVASQRKISALAAEGLAPPASEFWETEAAPRAAALTTAATLVIESEFADVTRSVERFRASLQPIMGASHLAPVRTGLVESLDPLTECVLDPGPLDEIGERWQRRMRRHAAWRHVRERITGSSEEFDELVDRTEMGLLDEAPWIHGDRLLSAFEIAHADVRNLVRERVREASVIVTSRSVGKLRTTS